MSFRPDHEIHKRRFGRNLGEREMALVRDPIGDDAAEVASEVTEQTPVARQERLPAHSHGRALAGGGPEGRSPHR